MLHSGSLEYGKSVQNFLLHKIKVPCLNGIESAIRECPTPSDCYLRADYSFSSDDET